MQTPPSRDGASQDGSRPRSASRRSVQSADWLARRLGASTDSSDHSGGRPRLVSLCRASGSQEGSAAVGGIVSLFMTILLAPRVRPGSDTVSRGAVPKRFSVTAAAAAVRDAGQQAVLRGDRPAVAASGGAPGEVALRAVAVLEAGDGSRGAEEEGVLR